MPVSGCVRDPIPEVPALFEVVGGLVYTDRLAVFNRWFVPTYKLAFRWTGNELDAQDVASGVVRTVIADGPLPADVATVEASIESATLWGIRDHWSGRYGMPSAATVTGGPGLAFNDLVSSLDGELHRVVVLRVLRHIANSSVAAQLQIAPAKAEMILVRALLKIAVKLGLPGGALEPHQVASVATFAEDLIRKRRPLRFEASSGAWAALVAACHLQASITGNDLPAARYTSHQRHVALGQRVRRRVTALRIWSA